MFGRKSQSYDYPDDIFDNSRMSFGDHLEELRARMIRAIYGLLACLVIGFIRLGRVPRPVQALRGKERLG